MEPKAATEEVQVENSTVSVPLDEKLSEVIEEIKSPTPVTTEIPQVGDPTVNSYHTISGGPETLKEIAAKTPPQPLPKEPTSFQLGGEVFYRDPRAPKIKHTELDFPLIPLIFTLIAIGIVIYFLRENGITFEQIKQITLILKGILESIIQNLLESIKERGTL